MVKFVKIALIISLAATCCAHSNRLKKMKQSHLARQELAFEDTPSQTPYPPAGIVPEIPFDLPSEGSSLEPENTYLPPESVGVIPSPTYGPPDVTGDSEATDDDVSAAENEAEAGQPEKPEVVEQLEENGAMSNEEADDNEVSSPQFERLFRGRPIKLKAAKLKALTPGGLPPQRLVSIPLPQPFIYANGRFFAYNPQLLTV